MLPVYSVTHLPGCSPFYSFVGGYPLQFATTILFGESAHDNPFARLRNGTASLVKLRTSYFAATCHHVVAEFRKQRTADTSFFQIADAQIDPERYLVSEDESLDIAVLDLTELVDKGRSLTPARFVHPVVWPPTRPSTDHIVSYAGYPGIWREQHGSELIRFHSFSSGASEVLSVREQQLVTTIRLEECTTQNRFGKEFGPIGGMSGGPVFIWHRKPIVRAEFVGFIYEYQESLDLMMVRLVEVIDEDGRLVV